MFLSTAYPCRSFLFRSTCPSVPVQSIVSLHATILIYLSDAASILLHVHVTGNLTPLTRIAPSERLVQYLLSQLAHVRFIAFVHHAQCSLLQSRTPTIALDVCVLVVYYLHQCQSVVRIPRKSNFTSMPANFLNSARFILSFGSSLPDHGRTMQNREIIAMKSLHFFSV